MIRLFRGRIIQAHVRGPSQNWLFMFD